MTRIAATFDRLRQARTPALIPFVTAGDPSVDDTVDIMAALVKAGADVIELGVPFSDPMADGPVIQRSSERALKKGTSLRDVLAVVATFRTTNTETPVVLMGYANPIERMGLGTFVRAAGEAGVDGVLIVDYPPEESGPWLEALADSGIDPIFLLSPTFIGRTHRAGGARGEGLHLLRLAQGRDGRGEHRHEGCRGDDREDPHAHEHSRRCRLRNPGWRNREARRPGSPMRSSSAAGSCRRSRMHPTTRRSVPGAIVEGFKRAMNA
jgi:tryptophan synthase alpha chain